MSLTSYDTWLKAILLLVAGYIIIAVTPVYLPVIVSLIMAFILNPLVNYFSGLHFGSSMFKISRGIAVLLSFIFAIIVIFAVGTFVLLPFIHEFDKLIINLPALLLRIQDMTMNLELYTNMLEMPNNVHMLIQQTIASAASFSADLARHILRVILGFASSLVQLVVVPVLTYYFLKDWLILKEKIILMFAVNSRRRARHVIEEMALVISGYIRGQVLISIVMGCIVFSGMYILKVDYPLVLGLLAACTETIPIIGPIIGSIPAIILAYLIVPSLAIKVIMFYIIVHQIENHIIVPNIMGHTIDLHPVFVIISLLIGGQLFGIIGMMMAVPVAALLRIIVKLVWNTSER